MAYALVILVFLRNAEEAPVQMAPALSNAPLRPTQALRALFSVPAFSVLLVVNALVGVANWTIYGWLPTFLQERFHLTQSESGFAATGVLQVASFVGIMAGGIIADRWSRKTPRARVLMPGLAYLAAAPALLLLACSGSLAFALAGLTVYGVARGFFDANLMPIVRQTVDERFSATAYGFLNFIGCMTGGVMTYAGGALRDAHVGLSVAIETCAGGILIAGLLLFAVRPRPSSSASAWPAAQE